MELELGLERVRVGIRVRGNWSLNWRELGLQLGFRTVFFGIGFQIAKGCR